MSWGISDCFRSLSLSQGQVPHALLTRPPLSCLNASRRINWNNSVRLECVRHAASVHPEPGSNSRNLVFYLLTELKSFNSEHWLLFTVFLSIFSSFRINETSVHASFLFALYFQSLVVRFSMTVRCLPQGLPSRRQLDYYTTTNLLCQAFFWFFFSFFYYCEKLTFYIFIFSFRIVQIWHITAKLSTKPKPPTQDRWFRLFI